MLIKLITLLLTPLIKIVIRYPGLMESKIFLKAMAVFPAKVSDAYDRKITESGIDYKAALQEGLARVPGKPHHILDLCTGIGFAAFEAAKVFPSAQIDALDQASEIIEIAKNKAKEIKPDTINFRKGDAVNLDYADNRFDLIITSNAPIYLKEAVSVLIKDGFMLVT